MSNFNPVWCHGVTRKYVGRIGDGRMYKRITPNLIKKMRQDLVAQKVIPEGCAVVAVNDPQNLYAFNLWAFFTGRSETADKFGFEPATVEIPQ